MKRFILKAKVTKAEIFQTARSRKSLEKRLGWLMYLIQIKELK